MSVVGIDLGTSGTRVGLFDNDVGRIAYISHKHSLVRSAGERVEIDADQILGNVMSCCRRLIDTNPSTSIDAVSFSVQGEAIVPVGACGQALALCPVSMDGRGAGAVEELRQRMDDARFQAITGQPLHQMFSIFKMAASYDEWGLAADASIYSLDSYIASRLGAANCIDTTIAARFGCFNIDTLEWERDILDCFGIAPSKLPRVVHTATRIGVVGADASKESGLPQGTPIIVGSHDQASAFWGAGGKPDGHVVYSMGSSDCLTQASSTRPITTQCPGLATYPAGPHLWLTLAGTPAGGWLMEWLADILNKEMPANVSDMLEEIASEPTDVIVLPYHAGSGTIDNNPQARGVIANLSLDTTRSSLIRAFVEASGYEVAKILEQTAPYLPEVLAIHAVGGGASDIGVSIRALASGATITKVEADAALAGAAVQALYGCGLKKELVNTGIIRQQTYTPSVRSEKHYCVMRQRYKELYTQLYQ